MANAPSTSDRSRLDKRSGRIAFSNPDFTRYWFARVLSVFGTEMLNATVLWQMWKLTKDPFDLGLVGLAQFAPFFALFLISGVMADRFQRKRIIAFCSIGMTIVATGLFAITLTDVASRLTILPLLVIVGIARAFQAPALNAIVPVLVPKEHFANAISWSATATYIARIGGPALMAGLLILGIDVVYAITIGFFVTSSLLTLLIRTNTQIISKDPVTLDLLLAGLKYIWSRQIIIGAIGLDLFAVLLGGATALLPIFASEILKVGEIGYGGLRMALTVGAITCMTYLTQRPIQKYGGRFLLTAVALFGAGTIVFGISTLFWLSFGVLFCMGVADAISVFIRNMLVQSVTPDDMRGRVNAVSSVFIGASNEIGEFESGVTAAWWGVVPAVVVGGIGTIFVAIIFARMLPQLRTVDSLKPDDLISKYR